MQRLILLLSTFASSLAYVAFKKLSGYYSLCYILLFRYFFSLIFLLCISTYFKFTFQKSLRYWIDITIVAFFEIVLYGFLVQFSLQTIPLSQVTILLALVPVISCFFSMKYFREKKLSIKAWLSITTGFFATFILCFECMNDGHFFIRKSYFLLSFLAIILACFAWVFAMFYFKKQNFKQPILMIIRDQHIISCFFFIIIASYQYGFSYTDKFHLDPYFVSISFFNAMLGTVGYIGYTYLLKEFGMAAASLRSYIMPILGVFWGFVFFHEHLTSIMILCLILVLFSVYWSQFVADDK